MSPRNAFRVSVPASSANLGPGFDAVGIALDLRIRAHVEPAKHFSIRFSGEHAPLHDGYERAILAAMHRFDANLPNISVSVVNAIPLGKGLGSSAAASILGLIVASRAHGRPLRTSQLAEIACAMEGHPDNALAALYGGAVIAASSAAADCVRLSAPSDLRALVVVPEIDLSTHDARALLPDRYARKDLVFTAQRASLLGAALASGEWNALRAAMRDCIHQPYRAAKIPGLAQALELRSKNLIGIALSGAGPSVLAIVRSAAASHAVAKQIEAAFAAAGVGAKALHLAFASRGALIARA